MKSEEISIIEKINQEDPMAFKELFDRFWFKIYKMALNKLPREEDASDITQEVFFVIWKNRLHLRIQISLESYLTSMLKHKIYDFYAKRDRLPILIPMEEEDVYWNYSFQLQDNLDFSEVNRLVNTVIDQMPDRMKEIFILSRFENMSALEISDRLGISIQTVRNQISFAIKRFDKVFNNRTALVIFLYLLF